MAISLRKIWLRGGSWLFAPLLSVSVEGQEPLLVVAAREETARTLIQLLLPDSVDLSGRRFGVVVDRYCGSDDGNTALALVSLTAAAADTAPVSASCTSTASSRVLIRLTARDDSIRIAQLPGVDPQTTRVIPGLQAQVEGRSMAARPRLVFGQSGVAVGFFRDGGAPRILAVQQQLRALEADSVSNLLLFLTATEASAMTQALQPFPTTLSDSDTLFLAANRIKVASDNLSWAASIQPKGARFRMFAEATWTGNPLRMSRFQATADPPDCAGLSAGPRVECMAIGVEARLAANLLRSSVSNRILGYPLIPLKGGKDWRTSLFGRAIRVDAQGVRSIAEPNGVAFFGLGFIERRQP
jgi:hypothetical protein